MSCPYLDYRSGDDDHEFDHERPYCTALESFVSPMQADVCNDRHGFDHAAHCEAYREADRAEERTVDAIEPTD